MKKNESPNVCILLSTYNGIRYIDEQIKSVLSQSDVNLNIFIRDDGSTDELFLKQLEAYSNHSKIVIKYGENLGVVGSFWWLLRHAPDADYYAFCDQDDYWLPTKLARAIELISKVSCPALYCSVLNYTDENLNSLGISRKPNVESYFHNSLVENVATGCSVVINNRLKEIALKTTSVNSILMHDWWLYILASAFGRVLYDDKSYIYYRQHGGNVVGGTPSYFLNLISRIHRFRKGQGSWLAQVRVFYEIYGDFLDADNKKVLLALDGYHDGILSRFKLVLSNDCPRRCNPIDDVIFKVMMLFKLFK